MALTDMALGIYPVIDETNTNSIRVAKKLFIGSGKRMLVSFTGTPALYFSKLVKTIDLKKSNT